MKVWNSKTGKTVKPGERIISFRNEPWTLVSNNDRKIFAKAEGDTMTRELNPQVFPDLKLVQDTAADATDTE